MTAVRAFALVAILLIGCAAEDTRQRWWLQGDKLAADAMHEFRLSFTPRGQDELEALFWSISTPGAARFHRFASLEEIREIVQAPLESVIAVQNYLREADPLAELTLSATGDYLFARMKAGAIAQVFGVGGLMRYEYQTRRVYRASEAGVIPATLRAHVSLVTGVWDMPALPTVAKYHSTYGYPGVDITPELIRKYYNITAVGGSKQSSQAVAEFEEEYFFPSDLTLFFKTYDVPPVTLTIVGKNNPQTGDLGEASLDVQYITGVGQNIPLYVWSHKPYDLVAWAESVLNTTDAPKVHSISYGSTETSYPNEQMREINTEFQKLGAAGFSVLIASGDTGTGHSGTIVCGHFDASFPATSPYATAVGATYLEDGYEQSVSFSGGGFSNVFEMPSYQKAAVEKYLSTSKNLPESKYYNATGRAVPDVSALGTNFQVIIQNFTGPISGTSASTPLWAGIISLLNDARYQQGKDSLGFLNPLLYGLTTVGKDITEGDNKDFPCDQGFSAAVGWDPISGLGTPHYADLTSLIDSP